jgi:hypothetical protein
MAGEKRRGGEEEMGRKSRKGLRMKDERIHLIVFSGETLTPLWWNQMRMKIQNTTCHGMSLHYMKFEHNILLPLHFIIFCRSLVYKVHKWVYRIEYFSKIMKVNIHTWKEIV